MSRKKTEINPIRAERVKKIIETEGISQIDFAKRIFQTQQNVSRILNLKTALTEETARTIVSAFPKYRIEWLLGYDDAMTKGKAGRMKIGDRVFVRGYIDEIRKDTVIVRNDGGYFGTIPSEVITGELPSAQPERMKGKWERHYCEDGNPDGWRCDNCDEWYYFGQTLPNFCPNCGADMRGEQDE